MLSLNPKFLEGPTVDDLVASGDLDEATGRIFRFGSESLRFHRHQAQSIAKHLRRESTFFYRFGRRPASLRRDNHEIVVCLQL